MPESGLPTEEPQDPQVPVVSEVADDKPTSAPSGLTEDKLKEILDARFEAIADRLEKQAQSVKDRRIGKIETKLDELMALREQAEKRGWDDVLADAQQAETFEATVQKMLDARLPAAAAPRSAEEEWRSEWASEAKKIVDSAEKLGISLSTEEYNQAMFGKKFATKADAYGALNAAIIAKAKGEGTPAAAVAPEGGDIARPPEPRAPTTWKQDYDRALASNDRKKARELLDHRWDDIEKAQKLEAARRAAAEAGVTLKET
jgi:hypothetical protein